MPPQSPHRIIVLCKLKASHGMKYPYVNIRVFRLESELVDYRYLFTRLYIVTTHKTLILVFTVANSSNLVYKDSLCSFHRHAWSGMLRDDELYFTCKMLRNVALQLRPGYKTAFRLHFPRISSPLNPKRTHVTCRKWELPLQREENIFQERYLFMPNYFFSSGEVGEEFLLSKSVDRTGLSSE